METKVHCTKKALKRDPLAPVGFPATCHVDCDCGQAVLIVGDRNRCQHCGTCYDRSGWIIGDTDFPGSLTAYRVTYDDGTSHVVSMAAGITLHEARNYFMGTWHEITEHTFRTVTDVQPA